MPKTKLSQLTDTKESTNMKESEKLLNLYKKWFKINSRVKNRFLAAIGYKYQTAVWKEYQEKKNLKQLRVLVTVYQ